MEFTINIGLLNNPQTAEELASYFKDSLGYRLVKYTTNSGSYHDLIEPTFVATLETDYVSVSKVIADFEKICSVLIQDYIAISSDQFDLLVYAINYYGDKDKFDSDYFLTI